MLFINKKKRHFYQNKVFVIISLLILLALGLRVLMPPVMTALANKRLAKESPHFAIHIDDIDLYYLKGQYVIKGISAMMKPEGNTFMHIDSVVINAPWKYIFQNNTLVDVVINQLQLTASDSLLAKIKTESSRLKKQASTQKEVGKDKAQLPLQVNSLTLSESAVTFKNFQSLKGEEVRQIKDINAVITNLTPTAERPDTNFRISADIFGSAPFVTVGVAQLNETPPRWDINSMMQDFDLRTISVFVKDKTQAVIEEGLLNLYVEAISQNGSIKGYIKPFVRKLKMTTPPEGFKFQGAAAATGGNIVKLLLTDSSSKSLATHLPFEVTKDQEVKYEILPALNEALVHRMKQNIQEGIEDKMGQKGIGVEESIQAEEAKKE